ncbi:MAG: hypothetical protein ABIA63_07135, partial [bacterium]
PGGYDWKQGMNYRIVNEWQAGELDIALKLFSDFAGCRVTLDRLNIFHGKEAPISEDDRQRHYGILLQLRLLALAHKLGRVKIIKESMLKSAAEYREPDFHPCTMVRKWIAFCLDAAGCTEQAIDFFESGVLEKTELSFTEATLNLSDHVLVHYLYKKLDRKCPETEERLNGIVKKLCRVPEFSKFLEFTGFREKFTGAGLAQADAWDIVTCLPFNYS